MIIKENGIEIDLSYDNQGLPCITIDLGNNFYDKENYRPIVKIVLDDVTIHEMFADTDRRWK